MTGQDQEIPDKGDLSFSPGVAYSARVNNVWQGGKDNFDADRVAAKRAVEAFSRSSPPRSGPASDPGRARSGSWPTPGSGSSSTSAAGWL